MWTDASADLGNLTASQSHPKIELESFGSARQFSNFSKFAANCDQVSAGDFGSYRDVGRTRRTTKDRASAQGSQVRLPEKAPEV